MSNIKIQDKVNNLKEDFAEPKTDKTIFKEIKLPPLETVGGVGEFNPLL